MPPLIVSKIQKMTYTCVANPKLLTLQQPGHPPGHVRKSFPMLTGAETGGIKASNASLWPSRMRISKNTSPCGNRGISRAFCLFLFSVEGPRDGEDSISHSSEGQDYDLTNNKKAVPFFRRIRTENLTIFSGTHANIRPFFSVYNQDGV